MNEREIYNLRLLKFADHIAQYTEHDPHPEYGLVFNVHVVAIEHGDDMPIHIPYDVKYHYWVFEELPVVFDEWYYDEDTGDTLCTLSDPEQGTVAAVIDFFSLSLDEFGHLFDIERYQLIDRFGGDWLSFESHGDAIARNIVDLVKVRRAQQA